MADEIFTEGGFLVLSDISGFTVSGRGIVLRHRA
jgi:hypothetical protein